MFAPAGDTQPAGARAWVGRGALTDHAAFLCGKSAGAMAPLESAIRASCRQRGMLFDVRQLETTEGVTSRARATAPVPPSWSMIWFAVIMFEVDTQSQSIPQQLFSKTVLRYPFDICMTVTAPHETEGQRQREIAMIDNYQHAAYLEARHRGEYGGGNGRDPNRYEPIPLWNDRLDCDLTTPAGCVNAFILSFGQALSA